MYLIFVAFSNYGDKNTKTFPIIVHFVQKKMQNAGETTTEACASDARIGFALQHILY